MDKKTLNSALVAGKYLYLLNLVFDSHRDKISRVRNFLEHQVAMLVLHSALPGMDGARTGITQLEAALTQLMKNFNMFKIAQFAAKGANHERVSGYFQETPRSLMDAQRILNKLLDEVWLEIKKRAPEVTTDNLEVGQVIHRFNSVMRNGSWLDVLVLQNVPVESALPLAELIGNYAGSHQGRTLLDERYQSLVVAEPAVKSRKKSTTKGVPKVPQTVSLEASYFSVSVRLSAAAVLTHPLVTDFLTVCRQNDASGDDGRLGALLGKATADCQVPAGLTAQDVADKLFHEFLVELDKLSKDLAKKNSDRVKAVKAARQQDAISALRGIDKKLLAELKANPDLLNKV